MISGMAPAAAAGRVSLSRPLTTTAGSRVSAPFQNHFRSGCHGTGATTEPRPEKGSPRDSVAAGGGGNPRRETPFFRKAADHVQNTYSRTGYRSSELGRASLRPR